jgi:hypothetical protein
VEARPKMMKMTVMGHIVKGNLSRGISRRGRKKEKG